MQQQSAIPVAYVNHLGQPVSTTPVKRVAVRRIKEAHHDGWIAVGLSPTRVAAAKEPGSPVSFELWSRTAKRERIRQAPFFSAASARLCCDLAQACGWEGVQVIEKRVD